MSKNKLLGPDGKALDVAKYRPKPVPAKHATDRLLLQWLAVKTTGDSEPLRTRVASDLLAIGIEPGDEPAELPPPPPEMTDTYDVAWTSAVRKCPHPNETAISTSYASNEFQCGDCRRYFTRRIGWFE